MVDDTDVQVFVWLGLSVLQAKVYLTLLETEQTTARVISEQTKIRQLDVQNALDELQKIGLVTEVPQPPLLSVKVAEKKS
jgi:sugar-specific transcriptional regulator TrmB